MSNGGPNQTTSSHRPFTSTAAASTRSIFGSLPSTVMPNPPAIRFTGDGLDFRRPAPTVPVPNTQDVIDLTDDYGPEVHRHARTTNRGNTSSVGTQADSSRPTFSDLIDVDEESTRATVDSSSQSPDLELLEVRSVRSQNTSDAQPRRPMIQVRRQSNLRPPSFNPPITVGGWGALRQHAQGHQSNHDTARRFHHLLHTNHPHPHANVLLMHQGPDIILPGDLDFSTQGFQMGDVTTQQPQPIPPTYDAPTAARKGFTRSPKEDDVLVCPNCEDELGTGIDDSKRQVFVIKACGHVREPLLLLSAIAKSFQVYCGECTKNRSPAKRGKGLRVASTKPFARCVVEGCVNKKVIAGPRSLFQIYL
ncbi:MAG: hypothetical protein Q9178_003558 [Gyalolechia marmorata]